jgi:N-acetylglucosaminyldiphosphoundecaprenol N-acetyl-beta-D-mannosaminyltransferase
MQYRNHLNKRNIWCILGLPFDALDMNSVIEKLHTAAINKTSCFISTPNLNFLVASHKTSEFKNSVINSDLNVVDGKPLIWVARLLNIPMPERVAGSNLIEELIENKNNNPPLKVFFFGGESNVAEIACNKLNAVNSGLKCVGSFNPGFGSIDEMSSKEVINKINQSNSDFVIVSLGAKKGQAWIERNRKDLDAPIISHLGAVINFIAGTIKRSPKLMQKLGLEWLWRIKEDPLLWKRYFFDGFSFIGLLLTRVLPLLVLINLFEKKMKKSESRLNVYEDNDSTCFELKGYWGDGNIDKINLSFESVLNSTTKLVNLNIEINSYIDAALIAKLLLLKNILADSNRVMIVKTKSRLVGKILKYNCCEYLLD